MNLSTGTTPTLRDLLRRLVFEKATDVGLFPNGNADLDVELNLAHQEIYNEIAEKAPSLFAQPSADVVTASSPLGAFSYKGTALDALGVIMIHRVEVRRATGEYVPLEPVDNFNELRWPSTAALSVQEPSHYAILGFAVRCYPEPIAPVTLRIHYVPNVQPLVAATAEQPWGGALPQYHELVALRAALNVLDTDKVPERVQVRHDRLIGDLTKHLSRRQVQRSRMVRMTDPEIG